ncbi:PREDICTED: uncharacterized protein LOC104799274 [Tarenaya hassleriana]|uniref:uncharacterized protein LOC104799274 n=1 Tax=Tarenaya hassleriana TaxID=28532 RepID=UPI00053CA8A6|nr:PREDICTED: uncharacterized protein LOC104799274 [Tarenaya hassleriana]
MISQPLYSRKLYTFAVYRLSESRDARSLTSLVKDIDAKLGPLVIKPKDEVDRQIKDTAHSTAVASEETGKKVEFIGKVEDENLEGKNSEADSLDQTTMKAPEDDAKESENGLKDGEEEAARKGSKGDMRNDVKENVELKDEEARRAEVFSKGDKTNNIKGHLSEGTETNAPEVMVMDEDRKEASKTMESRTHISTAAENKVSETKVNDNIDEERTL